MVSISRWTQDVFVWNLEFQKKIKEKNIFVFISREDYICYFYQYVDGLEEEESPREGGVYTGRF